MHSLISNKLVIGGKLVFIAFIASVISVVILLFSGCTSRTGNPQDISSFYREVHPFSGDVTREKSIFVFLDGTANNPDSATNVWRLFQYVVHNREPQTTALYLEGVGAADDAPLTGAVLGRGMEERILQGYEFVSENFSPGDDVYIFGFSRGAHQARALAGLISYAGVPTGQNPIEVHAGRRSNEIIELVKKKSDDDYRDEWLEWTPGQAPPLAAEIREKLSIGVQPVDVAFLGVWDTVPGSSLKNYGLCKEKKGIVKRDFSALIPGIDKGERYKTDSYPPQRLIAHAVSLDEKRSKFAPLLICRAINPNYTKVEEVWFPGAHADVGGGYTDSNELAGISLGWMLRLLDGKYPLEPYPEVGGNAQALAHWSIGDSPANKFSDCEDRQPPANARIDKSFDQRKQAAPVPVRWKGETKRLDYPIGCPGQKTGVGHDDESIRVDGFQIDAGSLK